MALWALIGLGSVGLWFMGANCAHTMAVASTTCSRVQRFPGLILTASCLPIKNPYRDLPSRDVSVPRRVRCWWSGRNPHSNHTKHHGGLFEIGETLMRGFFRLLRIPSSRECIRGFVSDTSYCHFNYCSIAWHKNLGCHERHQ